MLGCRPPQAPEGAGLGPGPTGQGFVAGAKSRARLADAKDCRSAGGALHFELCRAVRRVLTGVDPKAEISARARRALDDAREPFPWLDDASTVVVRGGDGPPRWWTFSGYLVNSALAHFSAAGHGARASDTGVELGRAADLTKLEREVRRLSTEDPNAWPKAPVAPEMARELKFEKCLPRELVAEMLRSRIDDSAGMRKTLAEPLRTVETL